MDKSNELSLLIKGSAEWRKMTNQLSHLLGNKLATLRLKERTLQQLLPLVEEAKEYSELGQKKLSTDVVHQAVNLSQQINPIMSLLTKMLELIREFDASKDQILSLHECIKRSVEAFPYSVQEQKNMVKIESGRDFQFKGSEMVVNILLTNLLADALYAIGKKGQGIIRIGWSIAENQALLHVENSGKQLSMEEVAVLFEKFFYIDKENIISIGLGFCRLAMWHRGGDVFFNTAARKCNDFTVLFIRD